MSLNLNPLYLPCDVEHKNGLWATFNNKAGYACSPDGYLLTMAPKGFARLDDLNPTEERDFWDFTFTLAAEGIDNPEKRGSRLQPPLRKCLSPCRVAVGLNDGIYAGQSIGAVHAHTIWVGKQNPAFDMDLEESLTEQRTILYGDDDSYYSCAATEIQLTPARYAEQIRSARHFLAKEFTLLDKPCFSIYTKQASPDDPRDGAAIVIESWTADHPSIISVSDAFRAFGGIRPLKKYASPQELTYSHFEKVPS